MNQAVMVASKSMPRFRAVGDFSRTGGVVLLLIILVFVSSLVLVYSKDLNRRLFISYQHQTASIQAAEVKWGKLLLEQSTWSTQQRIQSLAQNKLQLVMPVGHQVVMIK